MTGYWSHYEYLTSDNRGQRAFGGSDDWADERVRAHLSGADEDLPEGVTDKVALLVALADGAPDLAALAFLGAGPIEDLLRAGTADIELVDAAARKNENFRCALRCAWFDDDLAPTESTQLRRFGPPL